MPLSDEMIAYRHLMLSLIKDKMDELQARKADYLSYMQMKIREEDWHGVADCAADLRDIEAAILQFTLFGGEHFKSEIDKLWGKSE